MSTVVGFDRRRFRYLRVLVVALSVVFASALLLHRWEFPSAVDGVDARGYQDYAIAFFDHGIHFHLGSVRTYGYILFLAVARLFANGTHQYLSMASGIIQYLLFLAGGIRLSAVLNRIDPLWGWAAVGGLLLNPFTLSIVTDSLTDGLSVAIYVWLCSICVTIPARQSDGSFFADATVGTFLAAYALEVRPSNINMFIAWMMVLCWLTWSTQVGRFPRGRRVLLSVAAATLGLSPLLPQMAYNAIIYGVPTPLPVCNLSQFQIQYGIMLLKYDTVVRGSTGAGYFYNNPLYQNDTVMGLRWYVENPLRGLFTAVAHIFAATEIGNLFIYVREMGTFGTTAVTVFYSVVNVIGVLALIGMLRKLVRQRTAPLQQSKFLIFYVILSQVVSLAIISVSAVESRFGVLIDGVIAVCAVRYILEAVRSRIRPRVSTAAFAIATFVAVATLGFGLDRIGSNTPLRPITFDATSSRCEM